MKSLLNKLLSFLTSLIKADLSVSDKEYRAAKTGDYDTAYKEFLESANQQDATGQYNLGMMYYKGNGVEQDYSKAFMWIEKAAKSG